MSYPDQQQYPGYPPPQAPAAPAPYPPAPPQQGYPQQAPPQGYYQAPPQGYYQAPPPPQAPAPPRQHRTLADYLEQAAAGTKPLQWDRPGRQYVGMISRPLGDSDTEEGDFRDDNSAKLTLKIPLKMAPLAEYPDGEATFYCKGHDWNELKRAMDEAGAPPGIPQAGAWLDITYTHDKPVPTGRDGKPRNPRKVKHIVYTPPQGAAPAPQGNGQAAQQEQPPWTPPAPVQAQYAPAQQGPIAQIPAQVAQQYAGVQAAATQQPYNAQQGMQQYAPEMQHPQGPPPPQMPAQAPGMAGPAQQVAAATQAAQAAGQQGMHPYTAALMKQATGQQLTPQDQAALAAGPPQ